VVTGLVTGTVFGAYRFDRFKPSEGPAVPRSLHLHGGGDDRAAVARRAPTLATRRTAPGISATRRRT
jgi:hypothetical protein